MQLKYNHIGIPTIVPQKNEMHLKEYDVYFTNHEDNPYGMQWMRYGNNCQLPELVKTVAHVGFEVDNIQEAIKNKKILIPPNSPIEGLTVAFIEENGAPIEFLQFSNKSRSSDWEDEFISKK